MNAIAPRHARRAAPRAPPTAPPTTAVLSDGHVAATPVPLLLLPAADAPEVAVTVTVTAAAVPTGLVAVSVGMSNVPISVETIAELLLQQFIVSLDSLQQYVPLSHCRTFHDGTADPPPQLVVACERFSGHRSARISGASREIERLRTHTVGANVRTIR